LRLSVLVAAYNHERYVLEALDSAAAVRWRNKEIIVHDDGSSDATYELARSWAGHHDARVTTAPNAGASATIARLLAEATGDYVITLASDDRLLPEGAARLGAELDRGAIAAFGDARVIDRDGAVLAAHLMSEATRSGLRSRLTRTLIRDWAVAGPVLMYRRAAFLELGGYDPRLRVEDWDLYLRLAATGGLRYVDEVVAEYRLHGANASRDHASYWARMAESRDVAWRRSRDFRGGDRLALTVRAARLGLASWRGPIPEAARNMRRRVRPRAT
jgi:glycosyltransferase involved in cell wall biosynthesis